MLATIWRLSVSERNTLQFDGEVVWQKEQDFEFTHRYISGVKFVNTQPPVTERLQKFLEKFVARTKKIVVGHPEKKGTQIGPMISAEQRDSVCRFIDSGEAEGSLERLIVISGA